MTPETRSTKPHENNTKTKRYKITGNDEAILRIDATLTGGGLPKLISSPTLNLVAFM